jgi:predicted enzyme related to lactoylglutathione lyase
MTRTLKILLVTLVMSSLSLGGVAAADAPSGKVTYVGGLAINPSQDAKVLADWYAKIGIETKEMGGGYYGKMDTPAGMFVFGIHPRKKDAAKKSSASVSIIFFVDNFDAAVKSAKAKGVTPASTEKDATGQFAHFVDPDGNEVTLWGK